MGGDIRARRNNGPGSQFVITFCADEIVPDEWTPEELEADRVWRSDLATVKGAWLSGDTERVVSDG